MLPLVQVASYCRLSKDDESQSESSSISTLRLMLEQFCYDHSYNLQGDVVGILDSNGTEVVKYMYDAWGKPIVKIGTMAATLGTLNPFRYRGYVFDEEIGLYYLSSRYYCADWNRFISTDAFYIPAQFRETLTNTNLFSYCDNKPCFLVDSSGFFGLLAGIAFGALVGAIVGGVVSAVSQYTTSGEIDWRVVAVDAASGAVGGAIAATPIGLGASVVANAALGAGTYVAEQSIKGEEITAFGLVASTAGGAVSGFIGGSGADANSLGKAWEGAAKGIVREQRRSNVKYAAKQIAKYTSERVVIRKGVATAIVRFAAGVAGGNHDQQ